MSGMSLRYHLGLTGGLLVVTLAVALAKRAGLVDPDIAIRAIMAFLGLFLAIYANDIPKRVSTKSAAGQAVQRVTGRALLVAYLIWIAVWIFAPMPLANLLGMATVLASMVWIVIACSRIRRAAASAQAPAA